LKKKFILGNNPELGYDSGLKKKKKKNGVLFYYIYIIFTIPLHAHKCIADVKTVISEVVKLKSLLKKVIELS
jgi:hypothetical protein